MYNYLAGRLKQLGIRQQDLEGVLGMRKSSVSHRFTGRVPWSIDEMYTLMDLCRADYSELHLYFPRDGKDDRGLRMRAG